MNPKKIMLALVGVAIIALGVGFVLGNLNASKTAEAQQEQSCKVDRERLQKLYKLTFKRELDPGADYHIGHDLDRVLSDLIDSAEQIHYSALYNSAKALELAQRASDTALSSSEKAARLAAIDMALADMHAWSGTLPEVTTQKKEEKASKAQVRLREAQENVGSATALEQTQEGLFLGQAALDQGETALEQGEEALKLGDEALKQGKDALQKGDAALDLGSDSLDEANQAVDEADQLIDQVFGQ